MIPVRDKFGKFINIKKEDKLNCKIYFNDNEKEIKRYNYKSNDNVSKINVRINYPVKSLSRLFDNWKCIESIYFNKFFRNNVDNMEYFFYECSELKKINCSNFNTKNLLICHICLLIVLH